jgi:hypothetical protein
MGEAAKQKPAREECMNGLLRRAVFASDSQILTLRSSHSQYFSFSVFLARTFMDAVLVLLALVGLIGAVGAIMLKAWSVNKQAERAKAIADQP